MSRTVITQPRGSTGSLGESKVIVPVPAYSSVVIDEVSRTTTRCVKWIVTVTNLANDNSVAQEILAIDSNSGLKHSRYNIIGDTIPHTIHVALQSGNIELTINNPTADTYSVKLLRFELA